MRRIQEAILALIFLSGTLYASGWNDYSLEIGDGYTVFRANSLDVCIGRTGGSLILYPKDYDKVGPVVAYEMKNNYILTKNAGRVPRNLFEDDTFENVDYEMEWYFVIPKATDEPLGPFTKDVFLATLGEKGIQNSGWTKPKNPNFWTPIFGSLIFLVIAIPILAIKYFYISVPLIILIFWGGRRILRKLRQNKSVNPTADRL